MKNIFNIAVVVLIASRISILAADNVSRTNSYAAAPPNVLMIVIDDLNDWVGFLGGHPQAKTPCMDALAASGTAFLDAHAQAPLCNPSRVSVFSGLRPSTTGIYGLRPGPRQSPVLRDWVMLPQYFAQHGYFTACYGKVYHDGAIPDADKTNEFQIFGGAPQMPMPKKKFVNTPAKTRAVDWGVYPAADSQSCDWITADHAISQLAVAPKDKPFFLAVGFRLPHLPIFASQKWFDLFPEDQIVLPPVLDTDRDDTPRFSWYLHWKLPEPRLCWLQKNNEWKPLVRAYLAGTAFMDSQIGRVLAALKTSGRLENTIVVLWSDQGWHLGEKLITGKNSLWDRSTHVPLIFAGPGVTSHAVCRSPAELLDIYPTLTDLCGLPAREKLEGHSLMPQLRAADAPREWPALTTHNAGNTAVRTERWRYIRYADQSEELYDELADHNEWTNLATDPHHAAIKVQLAKWLPPTYAVPAPGSAERTLTYSNGVACWEGKDIAPDAPIPGLDQD
jgi:arylsulfatase A-like enzyme